MIFFLEVVVLILLAAALATSGPTAARRELEGTCSREEATAAADTHVLADAVVVIVGVDVVVARVEVRALVRVIVGIVVSEFLNLRHGPDGHGGCEAEEENRLHLHCLV